MKLKQLLKILISNLETDKLVNSFLEDSLNRLKNETSLGEIAASQKIKMLKLTIN